MTHYTLDIKVLIQNKIQTMTSTGEVVDWFLLVQNHDICLAAKTQLYKSFCLSVILFLSPLKVPEGS